MDRSILNDFTRQLSEEIALQVLQQLQELNQPQHTSSEDEEEYLSRQEVASLCKVKSLSTLWTWKKQGLLIPTSKAGRKPLYLKSDVIAFLEGKKGGSDV